VPVTAECALVIEIVLDSEMSVGAEFVLVVKIVEVLEEKTPVVAPRVVVLEVVEVLEETLLIRSISTATHKELQLESVLDVVHIPVPPKRYKDFVVGSTEA
jgi:hypothetical protein